MVSWHAHSQPMSEADGDTRDMTPKEIAAAVGVTERTAQRWCQKGKIPVSRVGGRYRVDTRALECSHPDLFDRMAGW